MLSWVWQKLDLLLSLVGRSVAKELIFTGRRVSGKDAFLLGLVNYCVPAGGAHVKVLEIAREISQKGPVAIRIKRAINEGMETAITTSWSVEEECYRQNIYIQRIGWKVWQHFLRKESRDTLVNKLALQGFGAAP